MKIFKHKYLLIYTNPKQISYYRYESTIKKLKKWVRNRKGNWQIFELEYHFKETGIKV